jgi:hypothetical protein
MTPLVSHEGGILKRVSSTEPSVESTTSRI